jgi:recombination protein RecA
VRKAKKQAAPKSDLSADLAYIARDIRGMQAVGDIEEIQYVPTIFTSFNRAVEIGGAPLGRVWVVHGPNAAGKSIYAVGIIESFARLEHLGVYYDAEWSTDRKWLVDQLRLTRSCGYRTPMNIEQVINELDDMLVNVAEGYRKKKLAADKRLCVIIDTITKLVPSRQLKTFMEGAAKGDTKQARSLQAGAISNWMKDVVPKLGATHGTLILVNQERANMSATGPYDRKWDLPCGEAMKFDNSMRIRVGYAKAIKVGDVIVGAEHHCTLQKSKVGAAYGQFTFYSSNGLGDCERGFDHAREVVTELKLRGGELYRKVEEKDGEYIISMCGTERVRVKGERELRRLIREGMLDAYRDVLNADIPRHMESMRVDGDDAEDTDEA